MDFFFAFLICIRELILCVLVYRWRKLIDWESVSDRASERDEILLTQTAHAHCSRSYDETDDESTSSHKIEKLLKSRQIYIIFF